MKNDKSNHKPVILAAILASVLMLILGLTYRVLAARLGSPLTAVLIPRDALERLPLEIADWTGQDMPLDDAIVRRTSADSHINRRYSRANGLESVFFYVACGSRVDEVTRHRPDVCYTQAGWLLTDRRSMQLSLVDGTELPCRVLQFSRGILDTEKVTVLNYFITDGQYYEDISRSKSRVWRIFEIVDYVAMVQITTSTGSINVDSAASLVCSFAVDSAPSLARLVDSFQKDRDADIRRGFQEEGSRQ